MTIFHTPHACRRGQLSPSDWARQHAFGLRSKLVIVRVIRAASSLLSCHMTSIFCCCYISLATHLPQTPASRISEMMRGRDENIASGSLKVKTWLCKALKISIMLPRSFTNEPLALCQTSNERYTLGLPLTKIVWKIDKLQVKFASQAPVELW